MSAILVKEYVNIHKKNIQVESLVNEDVYLKDKRRLQFAMKMRDSELQQEYQRDHKNGYCPHCGMLLPMNGKCDCQ